VRREHGVSRFWPSLGEKKLNLKGYDSSETNERAAAGGKGGGGGEAGLAEGQEGQRKVKGRRASKLESDLSVHVRERE
jgi:hypothetical protein